MSSKPKPEKPEVVTPPAPEPVVAPPRFLAIWRGDEPDAGPVSWLGLDFAPGEAVAVTAAQAEQIRANRFFEVEEVQEDA